MNNATIDFGCLPCLSRTVCKPGSLCPPESLPAPRLGTLLLLLLGDFRHVPERSGAGSPKWEPRVFSPCPIPVPPCKFPESQLNGFHKPVGKGCGDKTSDLALLSRAKPFSHSIPATQQPQATKLSSPLARAQDQLRYSIAVLGIPPVKSSHAGLCNDFGWPEALSPATPTTK